MTRNLTAELEELNASLRRQCHARGMTPPATTAERQAARGKLAAKEGIDASPSQPVRDLDDILMEAYPHDPRARTEFKLDSPRLQQALAAPNSMEASAAVEQQIDQQLHNRGVDSSRLRGELIEALRTDHLEASGGDIDATYDRAQRDAGSYQAHNFAIAEKGYSYDMGRVLANQGKGAKFTEQQFDDLLASGGYSDPADRYRMKLEAMVLGILP